MPIDFLSKNFDILFPEEVPPPPPTPPISPIPPLWPQREDFDGYQLDAREPHQLVEGLTRPELESLRDDVKRCAPHWGGVARGLGCEPTGSFLTKSWGLGGWGSELGWLLCCVRPPREVILTPGSSMLGSDPPSPRVSATHPHPHRHPH